MRSILTTLGAAFLATSLVAALTIRTLEAPAVETNDRMAPPAEGGRPHGRGGRCLYRNPQY